MSSHFGAFLRLRSDTRWPCHCGGTTLDSLLIMYHGHQRSEDDHKTRREHMIHAAQAS